MLGLGVEYGAKASRILGAPIKRSIACHIYIYAACMVDKLIIA